MTRTRNFCVSRVILSRLDLIVHRAVCKRAQTRGATSEMLASDSGARSAPDTRTRQLELMCELEMCVVQDASRTRSLDPETGRIRFIGFYHIFRVAIAALLLMPVLASAQDVSEAALKAAFIYNFAK